jgi:signal transduction histidine kinase
VTEPIGSSRPARATTWAMVRLTGPVQLERQVHGYQISLALALAGLLLAILLTLHLVRSLRRQAHAEENLKLELRRAEHLAALGKLLAGVAHEIRNPLAGIRSTVQLWDRLPDPARMRDAKDAVLAAVDRLHEIMSRLLYFARTDSSNRQPCSLNRIVEETLKLLEAQTVSQGVTVDLRLSPADPCIMGSPSALRQVVLNLVTNALQAMPDGGHLRCAIIHDKAAGTASMEVSDTGHGILPEARSHLFEPFFTTRPEGTGLGLALCQEIVAQHGGRLELAPPEQAQGTTFRVILPEGTLP